MQTDTQLKTEPFFIVGAARSGTTLLRLILGHHSEICKCEEMEYISPELLGTETVEDVSDYIHRLELDRGFRLSEYSINRDLPFKEMARDFLHQRQKIDGKPIVGATVHHHFEQLPKVWSNAKYIYLTRDPRDVARSAVQMGWVGHPWHGADFWLAAYSSWQTLKTMTDDTACIEVRFEDLISDAEASVKRVCNFLNVNYEPTMMEIDRDTTYSPPDPTAAKSWRNSADAEEIALIEARIGAAVLNDSGYTPSIDPQIQVTAAKKLKILYQDLTNRVRFRINRYGFPLWLQGVVSRRTPFRSYRERIQVAIDAVDNMHLK
ncbi:MAG: sulfotransferase [Pseudomonadales bacterium]